MPCGGLLDAIQTDGRHSDQRHDQLAAQKQFDKVGENRRCNNSWAPVEP